MKRFLKEGDKVTATETILVYNGNGGDDPALLFELDDIPGDLFTEEGYEIEPQELGPPSYDDGRPERKEPEREPEETKEG